MTELGMKIFRGSPFFVGPMSSEPPWNSCSVRSRPSVTPELGSTPSVHAVSPEVVRTPLYDFKPALASAGGFVAASACGCRAINGCDRCLIFARTASDAFGRLIQPIRMFVNATSDQPASLHCPDAARSHAIRAARDRETRLAKTTGFPAGATLCAPTAVSYRGAQAALLKKCCLAR
jgi:hypothetical protein